MKMQYFLACMLHTAESQYEDISGKMVADLGCGCGVLSIASVLMGCDFCYSIDIDEGENSYYYASCISFSAL